MLKRIKNKIEEKRDSKNPILKFLVLAKDLLWILTVADIRFMWKRRIKKFFEREPKKFKHYLAICSYFKDDGPYLKE